MTAVNAAYKNFIRLFFPHICAGCGSDILDEKQQLCLHCLADLPVTGFFNQPGNPVEQKFYGRMEVQEAGAAFFFTKDSLIENLIYQLKYRGNQNIGKYLGHLAGNYITASNRFKVPDAIVPLPLNAKRQRKRGYNQAEAIANGLSEVLQLPVFANAVKRNIYTETQTQRSRVTRWENMENVFEVVDPAQLEGKHLLLVDDVVTTGASLEACGTEILKVNGTKISIATLAYTI
jgi:ComF family protein